TSARVGGVRGSQGSRTAPGSGPGCISSQPRAERTCTAPTAKIARTSPNLDMERMSETSPAFLPVAAEPDHPALERRILERWERDGNLERLRDPTDDGQRF